MFAASQTYYHHPSPVLLKPKNSHVSESLLSVCKSVIPPFHPHPFLRNGHLQTCAILFASDHVPIHYKRHVLNSETPNDPGTFSIDVVVPASETEDKDSQASSTSKPVLPETHPDYFPPRTTFFTQDEFDEWKSDDETNPLIIALHGLSGGSHETYVRLTLEPLVRSKKDGGLGYDALVVNARGCGWTKLTDNKMFNAMFTRDINHIVNLMRRKFPKRPLMAVGFSLGANILANYLGQAGASTPLHAAVLLSSPHNMDVCAKIMFMTFTGRLYSKFMAGNLKKLFERNFDMLSKNPAINIEGARNATYLYDWDTAVTAPVFGFRTGGEYYRASSSVDKLIDIKIPTLIINAEEDPISLQNAFPRQEAEANPYICFVTTGYGGHLGWFEWGMQRWFPKPIMGFLERMAELEVVENEGEFVDVGRT
ncbi:hypothetical protein TWF225_004893 [Orbilia oligospora]|nr:hypothetical protein TWF225_004893 [Orbilia oligospora]KAF3236680.1 hypothetical protein TWF217_002475 [Orbilia oligospora]KAF3263145.1 hypothetical protein TWF128_002096 [Orbilia oligospora]KAF3294293.1 hypothetical protein TWF132_003716 [Orbilia oligospora]